MSVTPSGPELASYSEAPLPARVNLLFIHHSVGGQLLADPGPLQATDEARRSLHRTHPNGGGLRAALTAQGYAVHEASYGSLIGQRTDLFDWLPKFTTAMPRVLATRHQDERLETGANQIVMFKSCYPNNAFQPSSAAPGDPRGPALTLANAKATLIALRDHLARYTSVLFVYLTAPPLRADGAEPGWKRVAKRVLGRSTLEETQVAAAAAAREFHDWAASPTGWLAAYPHRNIVVFDYFDLLTGDGRSNFLQYASNGGSDTHPSSEAQKIAAARLVPLLNRSVRYAGIVT